MKSLLLQRQAHLRNWSSPADCNQTKMQEEMWEQLQLFKKYFTEDSISSSEAKLLRKNLHFIQNKMI